MVSVGITVLTSAAVVYIISMIGSKQHKWMEVIQKRTAAISDLLSSMKGVKMKGLEDRFYNIIETLRSQDIKCGNKVRMVMAYAAVLSFVPEFLCPFLTFMVLVLAPNISGSTFDATKVFTILSALLVLTQPLTNGLQILPAVLAGVGSLKRIGTSLLADEQLECRCIDKEVDGPSFESSPSEKDGRSIEKPQPVGVEVGSKDSHSHSKPPVFQIAAVAFHWGNKAHAISNVNITIPCAMLTMIIGPVGSGKSTLCETLPGQTQSPVATSTCGSTSLKLPIAVGHLTSLTLQSKKTLLHILHMTTYGVWMLCERPDCWTKSQTCRIGMTLSLEAKVLNSAGDNDTD